MQPSLIDARYTALHAGDEPIPGFRLVRRLGRGGFGEVWEAEGPGGFLVALKFVRLSDRARSAELRALEFVRGIHHPNILANFGSWVVDGTLVIGMELADRSLWDRYVEATRQGLRGIPRGELLGYLAEVAAGVDHLNGYRHDVDGRSGVGVQHRDLKPPNILLFGGGAKVADLGMARALMEGEVAGHTGTWTFPYAAPEFFRGETTRQSDQYGLAATYCQLRGGRPPFMGSPASVTAGHLFGTPDLDALPEPERPAVARALAKAPGDRWPDCRSFVAALRAIPVDAVPDALVDPAGPPATGAESDGESRGDDSAGPAWRGSTFVGSSGSAWLGDSSGPDSLAPATPDNRQPGSVATLILPSTPAVEPTPTPGPGRRRRRPLRGLALAGSAALVLATALAIDRPHRAAPTPAAPPDPIAPISGELTTTRFPAAADPIAPTPADLASTSVVAAAQPEPANPPDIRPDPSSDAAEPGDPALDAPLGMELAASPLPTLPPPPPTALDSPPADAESTPPGEAAPVAPVEASPAPPVILSSVRAPGPAPVDRAGNPGVAAAVGRGRDDFRRGDFARAVAGFDEALRLDPGHVEARLLRANARHRAGDTRGALADYAEVIRVRAGEVNAYVSRGQVYHEVGDQARAVADFTEAIRRRPGDADLTFRRGLARFRSGDYGGAVADFEETLRLDLHHAYAAEFEAEARARRGARLDPEAKPASGVPAPNPATGPGPDPTPGPRPTALVAQPAAAPARQPAAQPAERRRAPLRRVLPWPFARPGR